MPPPPPPEEPEKPLSEIEQLQQNITQTTHSSLDATRRMKILCDESKEAGIKTLVALDDQGEKLENIEKGMRDIHEDMVEAEAALKSMGACCWGLCVPCMEKVTKEPDPECFGEFNVKGGGEKREGISMEGVPTYGGFIAKYTNDKAEEEMEENMEDVTNCIGNLRNMAVDMGNEISRQNEFVDKIHLMCDENTLRLDKANETAHKLNG